MGTHTGERLVDGVVHNFIYQMVQAAGAGGADIHARADTHRLKAFQHPQIGRVVVFRRQRIVKLRIFELVVLDLILNLIFLRVFS